MTRFEPKCFVTCVAAASALMLPLAALGNDQFSDAVVLSGTSGQTGGSNASATKEASEPNHAGNPGGRSIWWTWTAPIDGQLTIDTAGSSFDTVLAVYTGSAVDGLNLVAYSDDTNTGPFGGVSFAVIKDAVYRVAVDGYDGSQGSVTLNWSMGLPTHSVTATVGSGGGVTPGLRTVDEGSTASFLVVPDSGYSRGAVGGSCPAGSFVDHTYTTGAIMSACNVSFSFTLNQVSYTVSASTDSNGNVTPGSQSVNRGDSATMTVTPKTGYTHGVVGGDCPAGSFAGDTYTTGEIVSNCAVTFTFSQQPHTVSASAGAGGSVTPASQSVGHGISAVFEVAPQAGYTHGAIGGSCPVGSFVANTYSTGEIVSDCSVTFAFSQQSYTVSASADAGGSVTPASQEAGHGATAVFTVTPLAGYTYGAVDGTCPGGVLVDETYTTGAIVANCDVKFSFKQKGKNVLKRGSWRSLLPFQ